MLFLLLQILLLLLIAAALGAAAAWWWFTRRYEDVTIAHDQMRMQSVKLKGLEKVATQEELRTGVDRLSARLAEIGNTDLSPVMSRLEDVERVARDIRMPETDLSPLHRRLEELELRLLSVSESVGRLDNADLRPVENRLSGVEELVRNWRVPEVNLEPVHASLASMRAVLDQPKEAPPAPPPPVDLTPVLKQIQNVEAWIVQVAERLEGRANVDFEPMQLQFRALDARLAQFADHLDGTRRAGVDAVINRVGELGAAVSAIKVPEFEPHIATVQARLAEVERAVSGIRIPETDLTPVRAALAQIDNALLALDRKQPDLQPVHNRFTALEARLVHLQTESQGKRALEPVEQRLASLQEALTGKEPDLSPVLDAIVTIDSRQDLVAVENRITAIEYSLAALHHMLRSRAVEPRAETSFQLRPGAGAAAKEAKPAPATPQRPPREFDPINSLRREGDQANLLVSAAFGPPDDLAQINGVGPILTSLLHDVGVHYFWQVAEWTPEEAAWVDSQLMHFRGRIKRDDWIGHARQLAALPTSAKRPIGPNGKL